MIGGPRNYILSGRHPVPCEDPRAWLRWFDTTANFIIKREDVSPDVLVSTVFLGVDHQRGSGPPLLFETMIFGGDHDDYQERYSTYEEAEAGHQRAVAIAKGEQ